MTKIKKGIKKIMNKLIDIINKIAGIK